MTWEYLPVLNKLLQILITVAIGVGAGQAGVVDADQFVPLAVKFVFYVALPSLITKGIGVGIDFYAETNVWSFIFAFLILRAIALVLALFAVLLMNWKVKHQTKGLGDVAVLWLSLTWISTVILGIPISSAVFGNQKLGVKYGILAGISSFIFQLPLQLLFLECHSAEAQETRAMHNPHHVGSNQIKDSTIVTIQPSPDSTSYRESTPHPSLHPEEGAGIEDRRAWWSLVQAEHLSNVVLWLKIGEGVVKNPVLWGISLGFLISLSTAGQYLRCPSETCIVGLAWIGATLGWLGDCVSPLSLFAMGLWMHGQGTVRLFSMRMRKLCLHMTSKMIILPLFMVGLSEGLGLDDEAGRAAILIASLPISMASFSLGRRYDIGESDLATNVVAGTLLMLPAVLIWNIVLDEAELYPIKSA